MRPVLLALTALLVAGCAVREAVPPEWETQREQVANVSTWSFRGRMAVKVEDDPQAGGQLNVAWAQSDEVSRVQLSGPFGSGAWQLVRQPERLTVTDADGARAIEYTGPAAAEEFMQAELGWTFPADSIRFWIRGLPDPEGTSARWWTDEGGLAGLEQYGWRIEYERYGEFAGVVLPTRINLAGRGVRLRIVVSRWDVVTVDG